MRGSVPAWAPTGAWAPTWTGTRSAPIRVAGSRSRLIRGCAGFAGASIVAGAAILVVLHVLPATRALSPISEPLSRYALTSIGGLFDAAVMVLAAGLAALIVAAVLGRRVGPGTAVILGVCIAGLAVLVAVPEESYAMSQVHWIASMVAFGAVPVAVALIHRRHRTAECSRLPRIASRFAAASGMWFAALFFGNILALITGLDLWRFGGLVERLLVFTELAGAALLAVWVWNGCGCRASSTAPAATESRRDAPAFRQTGLDRGMAPSAAPLADVTERPHPQTPRRRVASRYAPRPAAPSGSPG